MRSSFRCAGLWIACWTASLGLIATCASGGELALPSVFGNHMVLQRGRPIPVWGWATPRSKVRATLAGHEVKTTADKAGKWRVALPTMEAGGPYTLTVKADKTIIFEDVLIGDVWICSGQSNMDNNYPGVLNGVPDSVQSQIRLLRVARHTAALPEADFGDSEWTLCLPRFANAFSAASMYFAIEVQPKIGVPLGLIDSAMGATAAEEWTPRDAQLAHPELRAACEPFEKQTQEAASVCRAFLPEAQVWERAYERTLAKGEPMPLPPFAPADPRATRGHPGVFYNGMIAPLAPYGIRGVIWYQGEWNTGPGAPRKYQTLFPVLIESWRALWEEGPFPFIYEQLPTFITGNPTNNWAWLREAQTMTLRVTNTAMAVDMDNAYPADLHPWNKPDVGKRLGLCALSLAYGQPVVCNGPRFRTMAVEGNKVVIRYDSIGGGLMTKTNEPVQGFAVAGKDLVFAWARGTITNDSVVVWSDAVSEPVAVRYAWADAPICNLFNKEGLPAWPFRTDTWDDVTVWPKEGQR